MSGKTGYSDQGLGSADSRNLDRKIAKKCILERFRLHGAFFLSKVRGNDGQSPGRGVFPLGEPSALQFDVFWSPVKEISV